MAAVITKYGCKAAPPQKAVVLCFGDTLTKKLRRTGRPFMIDILDLLRRISEISFLLKVKPAKINKIITLFIVVIEETEAIWKSKSNGCIDGRMRDLSF